MSSFPPLLPLQSLPLARGYCRVSTQMQVDDGFSLETQKIRIQEHCNYKKLHLVEFYIDAGISGKDSENRPELLRLLNEIRPEEYIIITDLSRLSRNTRQSLEILEKCKEQNIFLVSLNPNIDFSTSVGTLVFTMLSAVAKMERENISKHVASNLQRLSKEGKLRPKAPFGYSFVAKDKDFEINEEQHEIVLKIISLFSIDPCISHITNQLNHDGDHKVLSKNRKFNTKLVQKILIDYGILSPPKYLEGRPKLEDRIKTHRP